jgi:hypothetical protein
MSADVEKREAFPHNAPIRHEILGRNYPFLDTGCPTTAADAEDSLAPIRVLDPENRVRAGSFAIINLIVGVRRLKVRELPTGAHQNCR